MLCLSLWSRLTVSWHFVLCVDLQQGTHYGQQRVLSICTGVAFIVRFHSTLMLQRICYRPSVATVTLTETAVNVTVGICTFERAGGTTWTTPTAVHAVANCRQQQETQRGQPAFTCALLLGLQWPPTANVRGSQTSPRCENASLLSTGISEFGLPL